MAHTIKEQVVLINTTGKGPEEFLEDYGRTLSGGLSSNTMYVVLNI